MAFQESDLNPIEHIWDIIGRRVKESASSVQTLTDLNQTLHQEWQRLAQIQIRRLVGSMRRRLAAVIRVNWSYTHYQSFSPDMKLQSLMSLPEYKLCLHEGILDSRINSFQVNFFSRKNDTFLTYGLYNIKFQFLNVKCVFLCANDSIWSLPVEFLVNFCQ